MAKESIVTYDALYEILRLEKYKKELQPLNEDFLEKLVSYLEEKQDILKAQESKDSIFASQEVQKTRKQLENIKKILKEIYERRESKIIQLALFCSRTESKLQDDSMLLKEEKQFLREIVDHLARYKSGILHNILNVKMPSVVKINTTKDSNENKLVKFVNPVPKFVGDDMNIYGPYESEEVAYLPLNVSDVLIKSKRVEEL